MARKPRVLLAGGIYHITSRGNDRRPIFKTDDDRCRFLERLSESAQTYEVRVYLYCLMDNHVHLLLETPHANLDRFMGSLLTGYTVYFNLRHDRAGHLMQGRYGAQLVQGTEYLLKLSRYIHLNPVRAGMSKLPEDYRWTSYRFYTQGCEPSWLTTGFILGYFGTEGPKSRRNYKSYVNEKVAGGYFSPLMEVVASTILGSEDFVREIQQKMLADRPPDRDLPALRELKERPRAEEIYEITRKVFVDNMRLARLAGIYLCHRYSGAKLNEIGALFLLSDSGVTQTSRRFEAAMEAEVQLAKKVEEIREILDL